MKPFLNSYVLLCISLLIAHCSFSHEDNLYEVTLTEKVSNSDLIVKGRVISQQVQWNQDSSLIITLSTVQIETLFKGNLSNGSSIIVRTVGGNIGNYMLETSSLLTLAQNDFGIFFCKTSEINLFYDVFSSKQGFIKYTAGKAIAPFVDEEQKSFEKSIITETGVYPAGYTFTSSASLSTLSTGGLTFYPAVLTAGTSSPLTICGSGFGTTGPDATHYVAFANADDGGVPSYIAPAPSSYVTWSDTLIIVNVPTPAGSGPIRVSINGIDTHSQDTLTIPYAILNAGNSKIPLLHNMNGSGGLSWSLSTTITSTAEAPLLRAMDSWKCATGINWIISPTQVSISSADANDGFNVIARGTVPAGVLGVCYNYYTSCNGGTNWNVAGQDIIFKSSASWYYSTGTPSSSQIDFESVALHELGHAHLLGHVVENSDVLFYALGNGNTSRVLTYYNVVAGSLIMNLSQGSSPCPISPVVQNFPSTCSAPILTDAWISPSQNAPDDASCIGATDIFVDIGNLGLDTVFQANIHWTVNGVAQTPVNWTGVLANGDVILDYLIGNYTTVDSSYIIQIWFDQVNGGQEVQTSNDTIAYSFNPIPCVPNNASLTLSNYFDESTCLSNEPITVNLVNAGTNDLTSCWLFFSSNGLVQDSLLWVGSLLPGDSIEDVVIGNLPSFYPYADIIIWAESPNGVTDSYPYNDTVYQYVAPQVLAGIYTIGGALADYNSISEAVDDLNEMAVCGDVILNIRTGVYFETINLDSISNVGAHSIVFQSEVQNQDSVEIHFPLGTPNGPLITFDSTYHVTFRNLSFYIENTGTYSSVADVRNGSKYITFEENIFDVRELSLTNSSNFRVGVYIRTPNSSRTIDHIKIKENRFIAGTAVSTASAVTTPGFYNGDLLIEDNDIRVNNGLGIDLRSIQNFKVTGNRLVNDELITSSTSQYAHLWIRDCKDTMLIEKNHIRYEGIKETIFIENCINSSANPIRIVNNSIYHKGDNIDTCALRIENSNYLEIVNNTFTQNSTGAVQSGPSTVFISACDSINLLNNILTQNAQGRLLFLSLTPTNSDFNVFHTNSAVEFSHINGMSSTNFLAHQSLTGFDANSVDTDPLLYNSYNQVPTNYGINDLGTPIASITQDILGASRNSITPDVGAFEFSQENYDIGVITSNLAGTLQCPGSLENLTATVQNFGTLSVDSFLVYLNVNNVFFDTVSITQTIVPGGAATVSLGSFPIGHLVNNIYEVKTGLPNNSIDLASYNNAYQFNVRTILNGEYSVGALSSDFPYLNHAIDYMDSVGVCGPVTFSIVDGVYTGNTLDDCVIFTFPGMGASNPIVFQSASADSSLVTLRSYEPLFYLYEVENIHFRNLGFNPISSNDEVLKLRYSEDISVSNCYFEGCLLETDFSGTLNAYKNVSITNSSFNGVFLDFDDPGENLSFHDNVLLSAKLYTDNVEGLSIINNDCELSGFILDSPKDFEIRKNQLRNAIGIFNGSSGIQVGNSTSSVGQENVIANNFIHAKVPMWLTDVGNLTVVHNNIHQIPSSTVTSAVYLSNATSNFDFYNNMVYTENNLPALTVYDTSFFHSDHNILFTISDTLVKAWQVPNLSYLSSSQWQAVGYDINSFFVNPNYTGNGNLHIVNNVFADGNALPNVGITTDIDDESRNLITPDIGADEIDLDYNTLHNIAILDIVNPDTSLCINPDSIKILVKNFSLFPIDSFKVSIKLFGTELSNDWVIQTISANDTILVDLGAFNYVPNTLYSIEVNVSDPNDELDVYDLDNTAEANFTYVENPKIVVNTISDCVNDVELVVPEFDWSSVLWSTGDTLDRITVSPPGTWSVDIHQSNGCVVSTSITVN